MKNDVDPGYEEEEQALIAMTCSECPRKKKHKAEALVRYLLGKLVVQDGGCALGRNELRNHEWYLLGVLKAERQAVAYEDEKSRSPLPSGGEDGRGMV